MSEHHNKKPYHNKNQQQKVEQIELDEEDRWHPTPEQFDAYKLRDSVLCNGNLRLVLSSRNGGVTLKELKDSTLHTGQTIEAQLSDWIKMGLVVENKGKYSFNPSYQGR